MAEDGSPRREYLLGQMLGEGGVGTVFSCTDRSSGEELAVKVSGHQTSAIAETRAEAVMLGHLEHPNIIKLRDVFEDDGSVCIVMDKLEGGDLLGGVQRYIMRERGDMNETVHVAQQMGASIQYLHGAGIVHRDIKPDNFLMGCQKMTDPQCRILLSDLGVACRLRQGERLSERVGTKTYWSPEVYSSDYGFKVDVWAMGVIMYCMASGSYPFGSEREACRKKLKDLGHVDPACMAFMSMLLRKSEEERPDISEAVSHPWLVTPKRLDGCVDEVNSSARSLTPPLRRASSGASPEGSTSSPSCSSDDCEVARLCLLSRRRLLAMPKVGSAKSQRRLPKALVALLLLWCFALFCFGALGRDAAPTPRPMRWAVGARLAATQISGRIGAEHFGICARTSRTRTE
mmetsp:Transcript_29343/g.62414  ORF Transcript_29343/g.62414 Transcript_29343/m.62414 type:complete len:402 (+) Transcript_29343:108-1313(+)